MNKARLEWVLSGLNRYKLTPTEDRFVKSIQQIFNEKNKLTDKEEEKLEGFYREKSRLVADRNLYSPKQYHGRRAGRSFKELAKNPTPEE
jgi:hypothetical protein